MLFLLLWKNYDPVMPPSRVSVGCADEEKVLENRQLNIGDRKVGVLDLPFDFVPFL